MVNSAPYEIGKRYDVPCVLASGPVTSEPRGTWWPVLLPLHRDTELTPAAKHPHWHIDWRFVSTMRYLRAAAFCGMYLKHPLAYGIFLETVKTAEQFLNVAPASSLRERSLICRRDFPFPFPVVPEWFRPLAKFHRKLDACMKCPHRGIDLSTVRPDDHGILTCPGHGLRWYAATGEPVPMDVPR